MLATIAKGAAMTAAPLKPARSARAAGAGAGGCTVLLTLLCAAQLYAAPHPTPVVAPPPPATTSQVMLPLAEYESLQSKPSVTVIDTLRVTGSFQAKDLAMQL